MSAPTVLVVEDELLVRLPIAEYLRDCGYDVLEATDAGEALSLIEGGHPVDLVFSDVRMPGKMDGFGLASWLNCHRPDVRVLLTSGYDGRGSAPAKVRGVELIAKPYSQARVANSIHALLQR
ncbi:MAG: response regulator [Acetobacteraceae bacterium]